MANYVSNSDLKDKLEDIEKLIKATYLTKEDADKTYLKRRDAGMIGAFAVGAATVLGVLAGIAQFVWGLISSRGN